MSREYYAANRDKIRAQQREYRAANREHLIERSRGYYEANKDRLLEQKKAYHVANRAKRSEYMKRYYEARRADRLERCREYRESHRDKTRAYSRDHYQRNRAKHLAHSAWYKADKIRATPTWSEREQIEAVYAFAQDMGYHVDHVVPLRSKFVCGLHVLANLQVIRSEQNLAKGNLWWPDMWEPQP